MREILNDIFTWPWFSEPHGYNFNGHLIRHPNGNLCIDPVEPGEDGLDEIVRLGVSHILLTNRNHSRASNKLREHTGARTSIHPDDAAHARDQGTMLDDASRWGRSSALWWWWRPPESRPEKWHSTGRSGVFSSSAMP